MVKRSHIMLPLSLLQFRKQMDGKLPAPSRSSRDRRLDLGRGVTPKASLLESHVAGLLWVPTPPPPYWRRTLLPYGGRLSPALSVGSQRTKRRATVGAVLLLEALRAAAVFMRPILLGVAVSLPPADRGGGGAAARRLPSAPLGV